MTESKKVWIGADPGGTGSFGIAVLTSDNACHTRTVDYVDQAIDLVCEQVASTPSGVGVDAPLWWCSGKSGLRKADQWIRDTYNLASGNVQAVNSLRGAFLAQGMMFVYRIRQRFPDVKITETHPKAVLAALGNDVWEAYFKGLPTKVTVRSDPDHERDAVISALVAREGFEGRWKRDLIHDRYRTEQNPLDYWLSPVHYFWPD